MTDRNKENRYHLTKKCLSLFKFNEPHKNISFYYQPPNSPDINVLNLIYSTSIQYLQYELLQKKCGGS